MIKSKIECFWYPSARLPRTLATECAVTNVLAPRRAVTAQLPKIEFQTPGSNPLMPGMEKYERNQSPTQLSSFLAPDLEFLILPERVFLLPLRMVTTFGREINKLQKTWAECTDTPTLCDK